ncbi:uncharacterized protein LOC409869 isoform X1 [Apis mellifera]|uniref:Uncharacterized protein LOC409869 isoform X1 n=1 Tax=Apis mellifera TaxID=7460 RepID=A0A7M7MPQ9_APIME|nr:uncharacterized protein LOC409869 isoform X1 [Apis mellifera]|eukprot:XP_026299048.1 uncharacterized protein LOC409869 isoform X1 [Apis mellifera]
MTSLQICLVLCCKSWNSVHNAWSKCPDSKPSFSIPPRWTRSNGKFHPWIFKRIFIFVDYNFLNI